MRHRFAILSASALLLAVPTFAHAQKAARTPAPTMEALLKQTGDTYKTNATPNRTWYLLNLISNGKGAVIALSEELQWLNQPGLSRGRAEVMVMKLTNPPTPQLLKAVAAFNDKMSFGAIVVDDAGIFYIHDFIMNGMLPENLSMEIAVAFYLSQNALKEFSAYAE